MHQSYLDKPSTQPRHLSHNECQQHTLHGRYSLKDTTCYTACPAAYADCEHMLLQYEQWHSLNIMSPLHAEQASLADVMISMTASGEEPHGRSRCCMESLLWLMNTRAPWCHPKNWPKNRSGLACLMVTKFLSDLDILSPSMDRCPVCKK